MDQALTIMLWVASGALIGGVVTPLVAQNKQFSDWLSMLIGVVSGAVGHVSFLFPLWLLLSQVLPDRRDHRLPWERDAVRPGKTLAAEQPPGLVAPQEVAARLRQWWWPAARTDGHSHRRAYIEVFVALAVITAIEVLLTVIDFGVPMTGPLVMLSTIKVLLVAMFFMHLRYDSRWYSGLFVFTVPFAALILVVLALA
jgi:cytochrome c oxidase subunit 4